jgi:glycosyltransferase involved in cell wall biosynthesis
MTGGLQEQVTDGDNWFGIGIEPSSKAIIGSQQVPYIYEDRVSGEDFVNALVEFTNKTDEERASLGAAGRQHILNNYSMEQFKDRWDTVLTRIHNDCGSWENRKNYNLWEFAEIK